MCVCDHNVSVVDGLSVLAMAGHIYGKECVLMMALKTGWPLAS